MTDLRRSEDTSKDEQRLRGALESHPWPEVGEGLMARLRAIPREAEHAASESRQGAPVPTPSRAESDVRSERRGFGGLRRGWLEAAGALVIVAAVAFSLIRAGGLGIAPANAPADATRTPSPSGEADAPLPPDGTRLYGSVAELLADPPPDGVTVWLDAYHGEIIMSYPGWGRTESFAGCPSSGTSPLLDRPFLLQLASFYMTAGTSMDSTEEPVLIAAGVDEVGEIDLFPPLPRHGRLVIQLGHPAMADCEEVERIAVVERVAYVFEEKADWSAVRTQIRDAGTNGEASGSTLVTDPKGGTDLEVGAYWLDIPQGLHSVELEDEAAVGRAVAHALAQPELPAHPITLRRYFPGHLEHADMLSRAADTEVAATSYTQATANDTRDPNALTFAIDRVPEEGGPLESIEALTAVDDVVYRLAVTLPPDAILAQPLIWWFEEVVDRFRVGPTPEGGTAALAAGATQAANYYATATALVAAATLNVPTATPEARTGPDAPGAPFEPDTPSAYVFELAALSSLDAGHPVDVVAARGDWAVGGGPGGLSALRVAQGEFFVSTSVLPLTPPSPTELGLVRDGDAEFAAGQLGADLDTARARLAGDSADGDWTVQSVEIRAPHVYAAIEWPAKSGLAWLYVFDVEAEDGPTLRGAARLDPAAGNDFRLVNVHDLALYGDRLLGASTVGLFDVDVADPASPEVTSPPEGLQTFLYSIAVDEAQAQAWATIPLIDQGALQGIDLRDLAGPSPATRLELDFSLLDLVSDGETAYATHGSKSGGVLVYDVRQRGIGPTGSLLISAGAQHGLALTDDRLFVMTTDIGMADSLVGAGDGYPGPGDRSAPGILVYDRSEPGLPILLGALTMPTVPKALAATDGLLLAAAGEGELRIYDLGGE